jgi:DNA polymerase-3 subunit epsilon
MTLTPTLFQTDSQLFPSLFAMNGFAEVSGDGNAVTLRRFDGRFPLPAYATEQWLAENQNRLRRGAVVDVETTGLDRKNDTVIELGLRRFEYDPKTGDVVRIGESLTGLQDPGHPLSPEITRLTGLTDADLKGQSIDWKKADQLLSDVDVVIAHNASFDRPFFDRFTEQSRRRLWACSFRQVDWDDKGFASAKLELLCLFHGYFTSAHRALNDVDALLCLLSLKCQTSGKAYLHELLEKADQPYVKVVAASSPFESKDLLKARGYRWDPIARVWQRLILSSQLTEEVSWLESSVYRGTFRGITEEIPALNNFKE